MSEKETTEQVLKKPETLDEIIADPLFHYFVRENYREICMKRNDGREKVRGQSPLSRRHLVEFKRDWYDRMEAAGLLDDKEFVKKFKSIVEKRSTLSSECRAIIGSVCSKAMGQALSAHKKSSEEKVSSSE